MHTFTQSDTNYLLAATAVIFVIELVSGRLKGARYRDYIVTMLCFVSKSVISRPLVAILLAWIFTVSLPRYAGALAGTPLIISYAITFVLMEFTFYWVHRWSHEGQRQGSPLDWLWRLHRTHHSASHLDVSVTVRQSTFWPVVVPTTWVLGVATYLGWGEAAALSLLTTYGWNLLTHTNSRWDDALRDVPVVGPALHGLQHVLTSPSMHHTHHGYGGRDGKMYRNYAVTLSVFDTIFGTLHIPQGRPAKYGVPGVQPHWAEEVFYPIIGGLIPAPHGKQYQEQSEISAVE